MARKAARKWVDVPLVETPAEGLARVRDELAALGARRVVLLAERDALVATVRSAGVAWPEVERLSGCSRPALLKRV